MACPALQGCREIGHPKRFREIVVHAGRAAPSGVAIGHIGGYGDDGSAPSEASLRFAFSNLFGCLVSIDARHVAIHEDGGELGSADRFQGFVAAGGYFRGIPQIIYRTQSNDLVHGIVVDDQDRLTGRARGGSLPPFHQREQKPERGAATGLSFEVDCPAHHGDQTMRDGQTQSGSAVTPRSRRVGLRKRPKDLSDDPRIDADSGIDDAEDEPAAFPAIRRLAHLHADRAGGGEFHGIIDQIDQDLADARRIAHHRRGDVGSNNGVQCEPFRLRLGHKGQDYAVDHRSHVEFHSVQGNAAGFDSRKIEDVVDDAYQRLGTASDNCGQLVLFGIQRCQGQQFGDAYDAVERGANLMAHVGQELRLRLIGLNRRQTRLPRVIQLYDRDGGQQQ